MIGDLAEPVTVAPVRDFHRRAPVLVEELGKRRRKGLPLRTHDLAKGLVRRELVDEVVGSEVDLAAELVPGPVRVFRNERAKARPGQAAIRGELREQPSIVRYAGASVSPAVAR